jgi:hypothetical protein
MNPFQPPGPRSVSITVVGSESACLQARNAKTAVVDHPIRWAVTRKNATSDVAINLRRVSSNTFGTITCSEGKPLLMTNEVIWYAMNRYGMDAAIAVVIKVNQSVGDVNNRVVLNKSGSAKEKAPKTPRAGAAAMKTGACTGVR